MFKKCLILAVLAVLSFNSSFGQHSVARQWNEVLLEAIREDYARPTIHARNLYHISAAMYDAWAAYDDYADTYFLGNTINQFNFPFEKGLLIEDTEAVREEAVSYAAYRLLMHRFEHSPGAVTTLERFDELLSTLGYDKTITTIDYSTSAAGLGNYIAEFVINYGLQDGANEANSYENQAYQSINDFLAPDEPGNPNITDPNRWQPLAFDTFVDQSGNVIADNTPDFLGPEWGAVDPFSMKIEDRTTFERDGFNYYGYHDPGPPPYLDPENGGAMSDEYKWGFSMVAVWSGHLDASFEETIDISPGALGNFDFEDFPDNLADYREFYNYLDGGDPSEGRAMNPVTGMPYTAQVVSRGDYGRVLAEFWADGPDSETPPGHWFTLVNYVNDHPLLEKRFKGQGQLIGDLQWDLMTYLILGGAMHDVAVSVWGLKGKYDYIRPISAIRYMADKGQSSDENLPNYNVAGILLVDDHIELVTAEDELVGDNNEHLNKIKIFGWKGPDFIDDEETDVAGVGWILAENWWPYQRPTFVTPPFAGYVSGHSAFSRAAAEVLTLMTGTEYFPGGMGEFVASKNEFLVFEDGPSEDIVLQWATYRDASDQCSLSRIWGGIHPPADDVPSRIIGIEIGIEAFELAESLFGNDPILGIEEEDLSNKFSVYPNPVLNSEVIVKINAALNPTSIEIVTMSGKLLSIHQNDKPVVGGTIRLDVGELNNGLYLLRINGDNWRSVKKIIIQK
jgi:uncharacterized protein DUF6851/type IX secretion system substrate protein